MIVCLEQAVAVQKARVDALFVSAPLHLTSLLRLPTRGLLCIVACDVLVMLYG